MTTIEETELLRGLRVALTELRAEISLLREDFADPTGALRDERKRVAREAADRRYDEETQRLVELAERSR